MKLEEFENSTAPVEYVERAEKARKKSRMKWMLLLAAVLLLGGAVFILNHKFKSSSLPDEKEIVVAEGGIVQEIPGEMKQGEYGDILQKKMDDSMFTINVRSTPVFTNGSAKGVIEIVNNPSNKFPCKVALVIDETGKEVYRCDDLIYPGQYINEIRLSENLEKGAYPATLTYYVYDENGEEAIGIISAGISIAVQN